MVSDRYTNPDYDWNRNIINNLRFKFGDQICDIGDKELLLRYQEYSETREGSEVDEDLLVVLLEEN